MVFTKFIRAKWVFNFVPPLKFIYLILINQMFVAENEVPYVKHKECIEIFIFIFSLFGWQEK